MDNYIKTFNLKMNFIINMVNAFYAYRVDASWFDISIVSDNNNIPKKGLHEYGTSFKMVSLLDKYKPEFNKILESNNILFEKSKKGFIFKLNKI